jgi:TPP-dependent trihydroxycyclohexane-1,2-dione (THcHDO) dehydratase
MQSKIYGSRVAGLALAVLLAGGSVAWAETIALKADLSGKSEVPPVASTATGKADVSYDTASKTLMWTVTFMGLSGDATAAHFHGPAEAGKNAGVVVPIGTNVKSPAKGTARLTDEQARELLAGRWYINIHTAAHKDGEIRGQLTK